MIQATNQNAYLFEATALEFAAKVDRQIKAGRYRRGDLFLAAVESKVPSGGHILDYGCGPGRISALLAGHGFRVLGIDPSPAMIAAAREQALGGLQVAFEVCTESLPDSERGGFDAVVCSSVIEYEREPELLLKRFHAVLRPFGALIISFANSRSVSRALFQHRNLHLGAQVHTWSWRQFAALLDRSGFLPVRGPAYFESFFDRLDWVRWLSASQFTGGLGLVVATRK